MTKTDPNLMMRLELTTDDLSMEYFEIKVNI